jgi:prophage tail gpP-like protein
MIFLIVNGTPYTDFIEASVTLALSSLANDFSFTASSVDGFPPIRQGDEVKLRVDDWDILTGYVEEIGGSQQERGHTVTYSGRDRTGDLIDSQLDVLSDIRANESLTLKRIIELVIAHLGLDLEVVDTLSPAPFNTAEDILTPEVGQSAFDFISRYAKKRQVLLSSTPDGSILITQSSPIDSGGIVQSLLQSDTNNILAQSWSLSSSILFNKYVHRGQLDPRAVNFAGSSSTESIENQSGIATDDLIRLGRQRVAVENEPYSSAQLSDRSKWTKQLAKAQATKFNCSVAGHQMPDGGLWTPNTLVQVNSEAADISRKMLIDVVTFSQAEGRPTLTSLEFVERNVYTIDEKLLTQKPAGSQNDAFVLG